MQYINIEGKGSTITFTNIGDLEEFDFNVDDLNEDADLEAIFEELDAYAQSGEINLTCDIKSCKTINPEEIETLSVEKEQYEDERKLTLDDFKLINIPLTDIDELIDSAEVGDILYLRVEHGDSFFRIEFDEEEHKELELGYCDCSKELSNFDLLAKDYYDYVCDTIIPEYLIKTYKDTSIDLYKFEPTIIYAKLFRVVYDKEAQTKVLEKLEVPAHYFLDDSKTIDEVDDILEI